MATGNARRWLQTGRRRLIVVCVALAGLASLAYSSSVHSTPDAPAVSDSLAQVGATSQAGGQRETLDNQPQRLIKAITRSDAVVVRTLLDDGADPNTLDGSGTSALVLAVRSGSAEMVKSLLAAGADPNAKCNDETIHVTTALYEAAGGRHLDIVRILLAGGADINATAGRGPMVMSPLMMAAMVDDPEIARELLRAGAHASIRDGNNALIFAAYGGSEEIAAMLLDSGVEVDSRDFLGKTPLMAAAGAGHLDIVKLLIARGADVNARDDETRRAYFKADFVGDVRTKKALEASGRLKAPQYDGASVLDYARMEGNQDVINLLRSAGAK
jgi:ankyrin repeat protein